MREAAVVVDVEEDPVIGMEVFDRVVDEEAHTNNKQGMNAKQQNIFDQIVNRIEAQEERRVAFDRITADDSLTYMEKKAAFDALPPEVDRIRLFVSGTAGTGKSFLINVLTDELMLKYMTEETHGVKPAVMIAAPTGLAAVQIKGALETRGDD